MPHFQSIEDVLNYAIGREETAAQFYTEQASKTAKKEMRETFVEFALEEVSHKAKLTAIRDGRGQFAAPHKIADLYIAEMQKPPQPDGDISYADVLVIAMQREKASYQLYSDLADLADGDMRATFLQLAQEEAKHKLRFEVEYDREVLNEN
jgi:rubrerythrin